VRERAKSGCDVTRAEPATYSTLTDLARLRGWSTSLLDDRGAIGEEPDRNGVEQGCDKLVAVQHRDAEGVPAFVALDPGRVRDH